MGDFKLLVDCFNTTTLQPTGKGNCKYGLNCSGIMLYDIANDPFEQLDIAGSEPEKVKEMLAR
jgi:hypothetical protein